jgi:predicted nuclease of predicted toxin-antitoxin system
MSKLLADENFPMASVDLLRSKQFDVVSILRSYPGISDVEVVRLANREQRLILTFDRDFGLLIFRDGLIPIHGVFYFRLSKFYPSQPGEIVLDILRRENFHSENAITVIEENFIRQKKF